jgi:hypothetical protein
MARVFAVQVQIAGIYECRGTSMIEAGYESGADVYLRAVVRSHGLSFITLLSKEAVVKSKNRDKFINSTVRVRLSNPGYES